MLARSGSKDLRAMHRRSAAAAAIGKTVQKSAAIDREPGVVPGRNAMQWLPAVKNTAKDEHSASLWRS
jgi:hypothetical protein